MSINLCIILSLSIVLVTGCAKKVAPDGGPKDEVPAAVVSTDPATGATNVSAKKMRFEFDDYVDRSVRSAFSIMPTARFTTSYAGDIVDVEFRDTLATNTTYVVTLGTEYTDIRGNKPPQSVSVVFSTGPDIDTGKISGEIDASAPASLVVFAYPHAENLDSSFSPAVTQPPYRLPVGTSGRFTLNGLADGRFRIMVVRDANRNGVIDASEDFGMASQDVEVRNGVSTSLTLRVGPAIDLTPPQAVSIRALSSSSIQITFSERVRIVPSSGEPFTISDSSGSKVPVNSWYQTRIPDDRIYMRLRDTLLAQTYSLDVAPGSVSDSAGLLISDTSRRLTFRGTTASDTATLRVVSVSVKDSAVVAPDSGIVVVFSESVDTTTAIVRDITVTEPNITSVLWDGPTRMVLRVSQLSRTGWQRLAIPLKGIRTLGGLVLPDTVIVRSLMASERVDPGAIQGVVIDSAEFGTPLLLRVLNARNIVLKTIYTTSGTPFTIDSLPASEIRFDVVRDSNLNGRYDYGSVRPYMPAESSYQFRQLVVVRARWTIEDIRLVIRK